MITPVFSLLFFQGHYIPSVRDSVLGSAWSAFELSCTKPCTSLGLFEFTILTKCTLDRILRKQEALVPESKVILLKWEFSLRSSTTSLVSYGYRWMHQKC